MWIYNQKTGLLTTIDGEIVGEGYSGNGVHKNDPDSQHLVNEGPIPCGLYSVEAPQDTAAHGPFAMHLAPDSSNEMFGRSGFLMHGDSIEKPGTASNGCVIMPRTVREFIWNSNDHLLNVVSGE